jgi:deoxyhypusine synthase
VRGAKALEAMIGDKSCARFLTVSGAMTVGKMDLVICDMIEEGWIQAISSTGALMAHGLVSSIGLKPNTIPNTTTRVSRGKLNRADTLNLR